MYFHIILHISQYYLSNKGLLSFAFSEHIKILKLLLIWDVDGHQSNFIGQVI